MGALDRVDVLVNCAGITRRTPTLDVTEQEWASILDTNLTGTFRACQVFGRHMLDRGYGRIVNVASLASFVGPVRGRGLYRQQGRRWRGSRAPWPSSGGRRGVNVNAIAPGVFSTALNAKLLDSERGREFLLRTPLRRYGRVDELAGACVFLASEAASFVNGEVMAVDGGFLASGVNQ